MELVSASESVLNPKTLEFVANLFVSVLYCIINSNLLIIMYMSTVQLLFMKSFAMGVNRILIVFHHCHHSNTFTVSDLVHDVRVDVKCVLIKKKYQSRKTFCHVHNSPLIVYLTLMSTQHSIGLYQQYMDYVNVSQTLLCSVCI